MLPAVLSAHILIIAAIFGSYLVLMVGLGYYIWRSGQPRDPGSDEKDDSGDERDPGAGIVPAAA